MLYTIIPLEYIFEEEDPEESEPPKHKNEEIEIKKDGVSLLVQSLVSGEYQIKRIISTNPHDYLRQEWQPGVTVSSKLNL
jgi:hypothetical protein